MTSKEFDSNHELPPGLVSAWREDAISRSERPMNSGTASDRGFELASTKRRRSAHSGLRLATALATALIFVVLLLTKPPVQRQPVSKEVRTDADQELLISVEHAISVRTPEALEPLTLMVDSSSTPNQAEPNSHKEHENEN